MKILQIAHSFPPYTMAGTEVYSYNLSKELSKRNKISVFFRVNNRGKKEYALVEDTVEGVKTYAINHTFKHCRTFEDTYFDVAIDKKFGDLLNAINPDVVHIHHLLFLSLGMIKEIKNRNIPLLYTLHDYWLMCYRGQLIKDNLAVCEDGSISQCEDCLRYALNIGPWATRFYAMLKTITHPSVLKLFKSLYLAMPKKQPLGRIERYKDKLQEALCDIDLFIAPSNYMKNVFMERGVKKEKIIYSPYGFDESYFSSMPQKAGQACRLRFGYMGTLLPMKGPDLLVAAFKELTQENIELLIYGKIFSYSGFESFPGFLKKIAKKDSRIKLMGGYDNKDVAKILSGIDVLIVPSIWLENAPLVIQEAFLSKTPVIASRIGGIPELVKDGVNGLLFNPRDSHDLKEKMEYAIHNPGIIEQFKNNMPKIKNIEENAQEMEKIYCELINGK